MLIFMCRGNSCADPPGDGSTAHLYTWFHIFDGNEQVLATLPDNWIRRTSTVDPERSNRAVHMTKL
jgi:hypothetical protein